jgi:hypothetical protein
MSTSLASPTRHTSRPRPARPVALTSLLGRSCLSPSRRRLSSPCRALLERSAAVVPAVPASTPDAESLPQAARLRTSSSNTRPSPARSRLLPAALSPDAVPRRSVLGCLPTTRLPTFALSCAHAAAPQRAVPCIARERAPREEL